jgi:hypothetical protein
MTQNEGRRNNSQSGLAERIVHDDTNSFGLRRKFEMIVELVDSPEIAVEVPPLPLSGEKRSITQGDATPENKNVTASADDGDAQRQPHGHH